MPDVVHQKKPGSLTGKDGTKGGGDGQSVLDLQRQLGNEQTVKTVLGPSMVGEFAGVAGRGTAGPLFMTTSTYKQVSKLLTSYAAKHATRPTAWRRAEAGALGNVLDAWFSSKDSRGTTEESKAGRDAFRWLQPKVQQELNIIDGVDSGPEPVLAPVLAPVLETAPETAPETGMESPEQEEQQQVEQLEEIEEVAKVDETAKELEKEAEPPQGVKEAMVETGGEKSESSSSSSITDDSQAKSQSSSSSTTISSDTEPEDPEVAKLPKVKYFAYKQLDDEYREANEFKKGGKHLIDVYGDIRFAERKGIDVAQHLQKAWGWTEATTNKYWKKLVEMFGPPEATKSGEYDDISVSVTSKDSVGNQRGSKTKERLRKEYQARIGRKRKKARAISAEFEKYGIKWREIDSFSEPSSHDSDGNTFSDTEMSARRDEARQAVARKMIAEMEDPDAVKVKAKNTDQEREKYKLKLGTTILRPAPRKKKHGPMTEDGVGPETEPGKDIPLDTKDMTTNRSGSGFGIFVMDKFGQMYVGSHKVGVFHHSSFLAGGEVAAAGELKATNGKLVSLTDKSGHYKPDLDQDEQAIFELIAHGIKPDSYEYRYFGSSNSPEVFPTAKDFMAKMPDLRNAEKYRKSLEAERRRAQMGWDF